MPIDLTQHQNGAGLGPLSEGAVGAADWGSVFPLKHTPTTASRSPSPYGGGKRELSEADKQI